MGDSNNIKVRGESILSKNEITIPGVCLLLLCFLVHFMRIKIGGNGIVMYSFMGISVLLFVYFVRTGFPVEISLTDDTLRTCILFFLFWSIISRLWLAADVSNIFALDYIKSQILGIVLFLFILNVKEIGILEYVHVSSGVLMIILYIFSSELYLRGIRTYIILFGVVLDPNMVTASFIYPTIFCFDKILGAGRSKFLVKISCLGFIGLSLYYSFLGGSRGELIAIFGANIIYFIFIMRKRITKKTVMLLTWLPLFIINVILYLSLKGNVDVSSNKLLSRMSLETILNDGGSGRIEIWSKHLLQIGHQTNVLRILFGNGIGSVVPLLGIAAHNTFLEYLFELGIFGLLLFIIIFTCMIIRGLRARSSKGVAMVVGILIWSFSISINNQLLFWVLVYTAYVLIKRDEEYIRYKEGN